MYYSISPKGSLLPRHNDERHEDTKGDNAWIHDTRRSISWLIYLNDNASLGLNKNNDNNNNNNNNSSDDDNDIDDTNFAADNGGQLRIYCRKCNDDVMQCGSNDGDIQVGWLRNDMDDEKFEPVFLDVWIKSPVVPDVLEEKTYGDLKWRPLSALYILNHTSATSNGRQYISEPFGPDSESWSSNINLEPEDFGIALRNQLYVNLQSRFVGTEAIQEGCITIKDILPTGGTLVLFDSVCIPHEVLSVLNGERLAIAGWFHEDVQPFPEWYGT